MPRAKKKPRRVKALILEESDGCPLIIVDTEADNTWLRGALQNIGIVTKSYEQMTTGRNAAMVAFYDKFFDHKK